MWEWKKKTFLKTTECQSIFYPSLMLSSYLERNSPKCYEFRFGKIRLLQSAHGSHDKIKIDNLIIDNEKCVIQFRSTLSRPQQRKKRTSHRSMYDTMHFDTYIVFGSDPRLLEFIVGQREDPRRSSKKKDFWWKAHPGPITPSSQLRKTSRPCTPSQVTYAQPTQTQSKFRRLFAKTGSSKMDSTKKRWKKIQKQRTKVSPKKDQTQHGKTKIQTKRIQNKWFQQSSNTKVSNE